MTSCYRWNKDKLHISVTVQPRAHNTEVTGVAGGSLKVKLTAPPVDGKANSALIKLMAKLFHVPPSSVVVARGGTSRHKTIVVSEPRDLPAWIETTSPGQDGHPEPKTGAN